MFKIRLGYHEATSLMVRASHLIHPNLQFASKV